MTAMTADNLEQYRKDLLETEKALSRLQARREKLEAQLADVDRQIAETLGEEGDLVRPRSKRTTRRKSTRKTARKKTTRKKTTRKKTTRKKTTRKKATGGRRGAGPGGKTLPDYIRDVLSQAGGPMRAKEIEAAVAKAGYESKAKDFYNIVATALREMDEVERVKRGVYKLKG